LIAFKEVYLSEELRRPSITEYFIEGIVANVEEKNQIITISFIDSQTGQYSNNNTRVIEIGSLSDVRLIQFPDSDPANKQNTTGTIEYGVETADLLSSLESKKKELENKKSTPEVTTQSNISNVEQNTTILDADKKNNSSEQK